MYQNLLHLRKRAALVNGKFLIVRHLEIRLPAKPPVEVGVKADPIGKHVGRLQAEDRLRGKLRLRIGKARRTGVAEIKNLVNIRRNVNDGMLIPIPVLPSARWPWR